MTLIPDCDSARPKPLWYFDNGTNLASSIADHAPRVWNHVCELDGILAACRDGMCVEVFPPVCGG